MRSGKVNLERIVWVSAVGCMICAAIGCATTSPQSAVAKYFGGFEKNTVALRMEWRSLAMPTASRIESAADRILEGSADPRVRQHALLWKIEGIPIVYQSMLHPDPAYAMFDTWVFVFQMRDYFETGPGRSRLADSHEIAVDACDDIHRMILDYAQKVRPGTTGDRLQSWAAQHPITGRISSRESPVAAVSRFISESGLGAFAAAGAVVEGIGDVTQRIDLYQAYLPKAARWQAEYVLDEYRTHETVRRLMTDLSKMADTTQAMSDTLSRMTGVVEQAAALTDDIPTLVSSERAIVVRELETYGDRLSQDVEERSYRIIDRVFFRALQLLGVIALTLFLFAFLFSTRHPRTLRDRHGEA